MPRFELRDHSVHRWTETVVASASGKVFFRSGLYGELTLGHISKLGVGYRF